jgi:hypothetical protein
MTTSSQDPRQVVIIVTHCENCIYQTQVFDGEDKLKDWCNHRNEFIPDRKIIDPGCTLEKVKK